MGTSKIPIVTKTTSFKTTGLNLSIKSGLYYEFCAGCFILVEGILFYSFPISSIATVDKSF